MIIIKKHLIIIEALHCKTMMISSEEFKINLANEQVLTSATRWRDQHALPPLHMAVSGRSINVKIHVKMHVLGQNTVFLKNILEVNKKI